MIYTVNCEKLKEAIKESGISVTCLAKKTGMLRESIYNKLKGKGEFKASEIEGIAKALHLSQQGIMEIFFSEQK